MAQIQTAFLCNYASQETSGLVSAIGAFVDSVMAPTLPLRAVLFLVTRIQYADDELDRQLEFLLRIARDDDDMTVVEAHGTIVATRELGADPSRPSISQLIMPIPAEFDRPGNHTLTVSIEGTQVWATPIVAVLLDSRPG